MPKTSRLLVKIQKKDDNIQVALHCSCSGRSEDSVPKVKKIMKHNFFRRHHREGCIIRQKEVADGEPLFFSKLL
jgi:hypothetical protein